MKDIKFRAQGDIDGIWVYGNLFKNECCTRIISNTTIIQSDDKISGEITLIDPATVGQFTGLKDKNGKEIYEGDIYEYKKSEQEKQKDFYKTKKVVIFSCGSFGFEEWNTDENGRLRDMLSHIPGQITNREFYYIDFDLEVIGNIYQNKELLES